MIRSLLTICLLWAISAAPAVADVTIFDNLSQPDQGGIDVNLNQSLANRIIPALSATIDRITIYMGRDANPPDLSFTVEVCPETSGQPSGICSSLTTSEPVPAFPGPVTFTGSFSVTATVPFWVVMRSTSSGNMVRITNSGGYGYKNPGDAFEPIGSNNSLLMSVKGNTPTPIPTLSEWAQILLALFLMGMAGWYWQRRAS